MLTLWTIDEAQQYVAEARRSSRIVGLIPTMGALHPGHLSLVRKSCDECDETIATIFVNPTQFGPGEDLNRYPRTLDDDLVGLEQAGATAVFIPSAEEMYPEGFSTYVEPPEVAKPLEGVCRPTHYRGVTTVVLKLFHAIPGHHAYFGRKDYQQVKVIQAMARDLNLRIGVVMCDTVRDPDGLAMSSRNRYLSSEERERALLLSRALRSVKMMAREGSHSVASLQEEMRRILVGASTERLASHSMTKAGVDAIDYAVIVDAETLSPVSSLERPAVALIAARVGTTRLIDNELID
jgi:pantoate--beta-alanine ligase